VKRSPVCNPSLVQVVKGGEKLPEVGSAPTLLEATVFLGLDEGEQVTAGSVLENETV